MESPTGMAAAAGGMGRWGALCLAGQARESWPESTPGWGAYLTGQTLVRRAM